MSNPRKRLHRSEPLLGVSTFSLLGDDMMASVLAFSTVQDLLNLTSTTRERAARLGGHGRTARDWMEQNPAYWEVVGGVYTLRLENAAVAIRRDTLHIPPVRKIRLYADNSGFSDRRRLNQTAAVVLEYISTSYPGQLRELSLENFALDLTILAEKLKAFENLQVLKLVSSTNAMFVPALDSEFPMEDVLEKTKELRELYLWVQSDRDGTYPDWATFPYDAALELPPTLEVLSLGPSIAIGGTQEEVAAIFEQQLPLLHTLHYQPYDDFVFPTRLREVMIHSPDAQTRQQQLPAMGQLRSLSIRDPTPAPAMQPSLGAFTTPLEHFQLVRDRSRSNMHHALVQVATHSRDTLRTLEVRGPGNRMWPVMFGEFKALEELYVESLANITSEIEFVENMPELRVLWLNMDHKVTQRHTDWARVVAMVERVPSLRELAIFDVSQSKLPDNTVGAMANLTTLFVPTQREPHTPENLAELARLPNLTELDISCYQSSIDVKDGYFTKRHSVAISASNSIRELTMLGEFAIDDTVAASIADLRTRGSGVSIAPLGKMASLRKLHLYDHYLERDVVADLQQKGVVVTNEVHVDMFTWGGTNDNNKKNGFCWLIGREWGEGGRYLSCTNKNKDKKNRRKRPTRSLTHTCWY